MVVGSRNKRKRRKRRGQERGEKEERRKVRNSTYGCSIDVAQITKVIV